MCCGSAFCCHLQRCEWRSTPKPCGQNFEKNSAFGCAMWPFLPPDPPILAVPIAAASHGRMDPCHASQIGSPPKRTAGFKQRKHLFVVCRDDRTARSRNGQFRGAGGTKISSLSPEHGTTMLSAERVLRAAVQDPRTVARVLVSRLLGGRVQARLTNEMEISRALSAAHQDCAGRTRMVEALAAVSFARKTIRIDEHRGKCAWCRPRDKRAGKELNSSRRRRLQVV
eukprot:Polyplicarium_translucidae@DN1603_c0_g2_i1.p1